MIILTGGGGQNLPKVPVVKKYQPAWDVAQWVVFREPALFFPPSIIRGGAGLVPFLLTFVMSHLTD